MLGIWFGYHLRYELSVSRRVPHLEALQVFLYVPSYRPINCRVECHDIHQLAPGTGEEQNTSLNTIMTTRYVSPVVAKSLNIL